MLRMEDNKKNWSGGLHNPNTFNLVEISGELREEAVEE